MLLSNIFIFAGIFRGSMVFRSALSGSLALRYAMKEKSVNIVHIFIGILLMVLALFGETVTLVPQDYRAILVISLLLMIAADIVLIKEYRKGKIITKTITALFMLPSLFIVYDFIKRAPYVF